MRTIALESSHSSGSIALFEAERLLAELDLGAKEQGGGQRTAQSLVPALQSMLRHAGWKPRDVELIAITDGPGSFTGLRAGVTTAKVFAYATGAKVVAANTLEVVAAQANVISARLWVVMDAQRQQVFVAQFALTSDAEPRPNSRDADSRQRCLVGIFEHWRRRDRYRTCQVGEPNTAGSPDCCRGGMVA